MSGSARVDSTGQRTPPVGPPPLGKVMPPELPRWVVPRPRVEKYIYQGVRGTVTAISAPAGTGKTTVLAAWAADSRWPGATAWLTLDEYDDQPDLFWQYLVAALQRAGIPALDDFDDGPADWPRLAAALAGNRQPAILVLDNLHVLHDPRLTAGFRYVLAHSGTGLRVIASSRTDPPLPLHQYLLTGDLTEIGTGQLAFTVPEAKLLLAKHDVAMSGEALAWLVRDRKSVV